MVPIQPLLTCTDMIIAYNWGLDIWLEGVDFVSIEINAITLLRMTTYSFMKWVTSCIVVKG